MYSARYNLQWDDPDVAEHLRQLKDEEEEGQDNDSQHEEEDKDSSANGVSVIKLDDRPNHIVPDTESITMHTITIYV